MAVLTSITLTAGGKPYPIVVQNTANPPVNQPPPDITWDISSQDVTVAPTSDSVGFDFTAQASAATEMVTATATYKGPGNPNPVVGPALQINVTAEVTVDALQYADYEQPAAA